MNRMSSLLVGLSLSHPRPSSLRAHGGYDGVHVEAVGGWMPDALTSTEALANATRLLEFAEDSLANPVAMEALTRLSEIWVQVAGLLRESE